MAKPEPTETEQIATHSVGEGLDFACSLLADGIGCMADQRPDASPGLLKALSEYISHRYAGEDLLALEYLVLLGRELRESTDVRWSQFWRQLEWVGQQMGVSPESLGKAG
jgi:hypothetical protein